MKRIKGILLLGFALGFLSACAPTPYFRLRSTEPGMPERTLTLLFAGDVMGHGAQIKSAFQAGGGRYDYTGVFQELRPYFSGVDLSIANLEVTFAGPPYAGYPSFSSPDALAEALKKAGISLVWVANNHALDRGAGGVLSTLRVLDAAGLSHLGAYRDPADRDRRCPLILEKNGIRMAFLNYTVGTNDQIAAPPVVLNTWDANQAALDLEKAQALNTDVVIVGMHWGDEYQRQPNARQKAIADWLLGHGADIIIGGHPHVVQPIEKRRVEDSNQQKWVAYSLGNFVSNQPDPLTRGGMVLGLRISKTDSGVEFSLSYLPVWTHVYRKQEKKYFKVIPLSTNRLAQVEKQIPAKEREQMKVFLEALQFDTQGISQIPFR